MRKFSGRKLREARDKRKVTQTDLATALRARIPGCGTTQTQVSRWEKAGQTPRDYILEAIAKELNVKVDDLLEEVPGDAPFRG